ncbi:MULTISPECIES: 1-phosphofructokinase family hexose kinase [Rhodopseudomonas]|uniref:Phosphofructokinase n=1 Tax=Rhodopseudomonas palustris TaxID=1076 RepID=A0A0D7DYY8_RHOPL|nr:MULTISPECIES: 1-phosphofructokinase family hexose kinase [Rhodopseudomonas]KIZ33764.1 phosphofructokinase [Rhodopseudomonas palustris]MDF3814516.1 1-phosphofructokinase family hexose kinase [Rhodopseudomonas sp. BAL398]WOK16029.1 1-phosphofructokinase family hexose kinase [Rhodopseudomonas sp. BAL398]
MPHIVTVTPSPAIDASSSVEQLAPFSKLRCGPLIRHPGGGGINVARVIRRLGGDVLAIYPTGGMTGDLLHDLIRREGIQSLEIPIAAETRENFTVFEISTRRQFRFVVPGAELTEAEWTQLIPAASARPAPAFIIASGSLPPGVPHDFFAQLARAGKAQGSKVIVDSSGVPLTAALDQGVYLIKPSLSEFQHLTGVTSDDQGALIAAGRDLIDQGRVEMVALSMGPNGALLITRDYALRAEALPIAAESVVGAGDSFLGALIWSLTCRDDLETALRYGIAAGSAALLNPGTELSRLDDVQRFFAQTSVRRIG